MMSLLFRIILTVIVCPVAANFNFNINLQPKQLINAENMGQSFRGNRSSSDHFKLLVMDGKHLLVGARNAVYNLSMDTLTVQKILEWSSSAADVEMCLKKSKSEEDCHNYIRVLVKQNDGKILVCGTNSFKPLCRQYTMSDDSNFHVHSEFSGYAVSPYDPNHNSTAFYASETNELYTGSVSDFSGVDSLVYRKPLSPSSEASAGEMRTLRNDLKCLNDPNFVSSFGDQSSVFFWFRENAAEFTDHGRQVYGRVARVCKNDHGATAASSSSSQSRRHASRNSLGTWTSFVKARLNCSLPGEIPFYFNELQAATQPMSGNYFSTLSEPTSLVYAVFSSPYSGIQASAICAFSMDDIQRIFNQGAFKHQPDANSLWLPVYKPTEPDRRPGSCDAKPKSLTSESINFIQKNSLMHEAVPNFFAQPLLVDTNLKSRMTQIAVHRARAVDGSAYDVLFVGTSDGRLLKLVNAAQGSAGGTRPSASAVLIDSVRLFADQSAVRSLLIYEAQSGGPPDEWPADVSTKSGTDATPQASAAKLVVVSRDEVRTAPLHFCGNRTTCGSCVRLRDPYCAWDVAAGRCMGITDGTWPKDRTLVQNIRTGQTYNCPLGEMDAEFYSINEIYAPSTSRDAVQPAGVYSVESMALAVALTVAAAAGLGFLLGFRLADRRRRGGHHRHRHAAGDRLSSSSGGGGGEHSPACCSADDDYEAPPSYKSTATGGGGGVVGTASDFYESAMSALHRPATKFTFDLTRDPPTLNFTEGGNNALDCVKLNNHCGGVVKASNLSPDKNLLPTLNNGTLPKDYKVKKVYL